MTDYTNFQEHPKFYSTINGAAFMALLATYGTWFFAGTIALTHLPVILLATGMGAGAGFLGVQLFQVAKSWIASGKAFFNKVMNVLDQGERGLKNFNDTVMPDVENKLRQVDALVKGLSDEIEKADGCLEGLKALLEACKGTGDKVNETVDAAKEMAEQGFAAFAEVLDEAKGIGSKVHVTLENVDRLLDTAGHTAEAVADATAPMGAPVRGIRWLFGYDRPNLEAAQSEIDERYRVVSSEDGDTDCDEGEERFEPCREGEGSTKHRK